MEYAGVCGRLFANVLRKGLAVMFIMTPLYVYVPFETTSDPSISGNEERG